MASPASTKGDAKNHSARIKADPVDQTTRNFVMAGAENNRFYTKNQRYVYMSRIPLKRTYIRSMENQRDDASIPRSAEEHVVSETKRTVTSVYGKPPPHYRYIHASQPGVVQVVAPPSHVRYVERTDQTVHTPEMNRYKRIRMAPQGLQTHTGVPQSWTVNAPRTSSGDEPWRDQFRRLSNVNVQEPNPRYVTLVRHHQVPAHARYMEESEADRREMSHNAGPGTFRGDQHQPLLRSTEKQVIHRQVSTNVHRSTPPTHETKRNLGIRMTEYQPVKNYSFTSPYRQIKGEHVIVHPQSKVASVHDPTGNRYQLDSAVASKHPIESPNPQKKKSAMRKDVRSSPPPAASSPPPPVVTTATRWTTAEGTRVPSPVPLLHHMSKPANGFDKLDLLCSATLEMGRLYDNPTGCSCPKSKCIALYCDCFKAGRRCDAEKCKCTECKNTVAESGPDGTRTKAIRSILARNPRAFTTAGIGNPSLKLPPGEVACNCVRSRCLKLYCACFQTGTACDPLKCTCVGCYNTIDDESGYRHVMMQQYLEKHPDVFLNKKEQLPREIGIGCACKNNRCIRKYCECYRTNVQCSEKCSCRNCENGTSSKNRPHRNTTPTTGTMMISNTTTTTATSAMSTTTTNLPKHAPDGTEAQSLAHNDSIIEI